jgi:hypothetical protein
MFAFLMITLLVTLGIAIAGWFRPLPAKPPPALTYTDQQVTDAKAKVCAAYDKVHSAVKASSASDEGTDQTSQLAFALNERQALLAGSGYLRAVLSAEPATPNELAKTIRKLTDVFQDLVVDYLNGWNESQMASPLQAGNEATLTIERLCK